MKTNPLAKTKRSIRLGGALLLWIGLGVLSLTGGCSSRMPRELIDASLAAMDAARLAAADKVTPRSWEALVRKKTELDAAMAKGNAGDAGNLARELMELASKTRAEAVEATRRAEGTERFKAAKNSLEAARTALAGVVSPRQRDSAEFGVLQVRLAGAERDLKRAETALQGGELDTVKTVAATVSETAEKIRTEAGSLTRKRARPALPPEVPPPAE